MSDPNKRPLWLYGDQMSELDFHLMMRGPIKTIKHMWRMTGVDSAEYWLELGQQVGTGISWLKKPTDFFTKQSLFAFHPDYRTLVVLTAYGEPAKANMEQIALWEEKNEADRRKYEELKKKFGNT